MPHSTSCMTATPPVCSANTFDGIPADIPVAVPMANVGDYRNATGFEAVMGYLYLSGQTDRMLELIQNGMEHYQNSAEEK